MGCVCLLLLTLGATPDVTACLPPDAVALRGLLGARFSLNETGRLLKADEGALLGGYLKRPGSHPWIGEHAGKFLHAAVLTWKNTGHADLRAKCDRIANGLIASQEEDGYLGTYDKPTRWSTAGNRGWDVWSHKYCLAGLLTYYQYTGDKRALDACVRAGDLLLKTFGPRPGQLSLNQHSTHMGMASGSVLQPLVWLYQASGEPRFLDWCLWVVDAWEHAPGGPKLVTSQLAGKSVNQTANGKAYEMMSCLTGLAELGRALKLAGRDAEAEPLLKAARHAWDDIAANRLYITGATSAREHFQPDGSFPNTANVGETCANVTREQLGLELFRASADPTITDSFERTLYGHLLGAQQPDNGDWCYYTSLEGNKGYHHSIDCCVSSGPRGLALLPTFFATRDPDGLRLNLYSSATIKLPELALTLTTAYPYEGTIKVAVDRAPTGPFALRLRIPAWTDSAALALNGAVLDPPRGGYAEVKRTWATGDTLTLTLGLPLKVVVGERDNAGRVALVRGPLVLCADAALAGGPVNGLAPASLDPAKLPLRLSPRAADDAEYAHGAVFELPGDKGPLRLTDFAHAGASGKAVRVWLRNPELPAPVPTAFTHESWSRDGNIDGSLLDGDPNTCRVTFDGTKRDQDWFAIAADAPATVAKVTFVQGRLFHDGGWWDASGGRPRVEYRERIDGPWLPFGELTGYPATTATNNAGLREGQAFVVQAAAPVKAVALRVLGKPACGDDPRQSFAGCAELTAGG